jgi:hypothetical protein
VTTIAYIHRLVIPAAYDLLPLHMASVEATAMLLAIGLQESDGFSARAQYGNGPARGFWQFERGGGVAGVLQHHRTGPIITALCEQTFQVSPVPSECHRAIEHNDILAAVFARLLLWTLPRPLPGRSEVDLAWRQYLASWRPGKPHEETWSLSYSLGWRMVQNGHAA